LYHPVSLYKDDNLQGWRENYVTKLSSGEIIAIYDDMTEQQQALNQLNASEERFRLLVEQSPLSIEIYNQQGKLIQANRAWELLWNIPRREDFVNSYNIFEDTQQDEKGVSDLVKRAFEGESFDLPELVYESRSKGHPGRRRCVHTSIYPLKDDQDTVRNVGIMYEDITLRIDSEKERDRLFSELENKNAALERFTYTVSHDLKSPLITIRGFMGMIKKDFATGNYEQIKEDIVRIDKAADRMYSLLDDVLHLSRIGRTVNIADIVSFSTLAREVVEMLTSRIQGKKINVKIHENLPVVRGDKIRLYEVFQNLIENAIKFIGNEDKREIEIGSILQENKTVCFIRDTGVGVDKRYHDKIFDLFDQLDQDSEGSGVGLALVKRIIETHGGQIWLESDGVNRGSTFYFIVPEKQE